MLKIVKGDLIKMAEEGHFDAIAHGCNCFCSMSAGIAAQIAKKYPQAVIVDNSTQHGDILKLGTYSETASCVPDGSSIYRIFNLYTQFQPGRDLDYVALTLCLRKLGNRYRVTNTRIGLPKIGCGIAGGDWEKVEKIIEEEMKACDVTIVEFDNAK